jgi:riboflavin synthase
MFTGIIQYVGTVAALRATPSGMRLVIDARNWNHQPSHGDSIAVNGCCLTVVGNGCSAGDASEPAKQLEFDVVPQTLGLTTLGQLRVGQRVNLEHAVTPPTLLGGHIVQGHVDGIGVVRDIVTAGNEHRLRIQPPPALMDCVIERGSIAVDGVSLTVAGVTGSEFEVALIPTTLALTALGSLTTAAQVNIETDYIARTIVQWIQRTHSK